MASFQTYLRPVLFLMSAVETSMVTVGSLLWRQTKHRFQDMFTGLQSRAAGVYQGVRRRASYVYEDIQVKAGDTYQVVQGHTTETCQQWRNRVNLLYIQCQLRLSLAVHRFQFDLSLFIKKTKASLGRNFDVYMGVHLKDAKERFCSVHKWTRIKVTRCKKAVAESVKINLERMSLKAREYEDLLDEKLHSLSNSTTTKRLLPAEKPEASPRISSTSSSTTATANEDPGPSEETEHTREDDNSSRASSTRGLLEGVLASSDTLAAHQAPPPTPPSLPPPSYDEPPPRPPERPPKKPTLRSLFHGPSNEATSPNSNPTQNGLVSHSSSNSFSEKANVADSEMRRIEESANELRNLSPARPYYYRKPPAPDPPKSPELPVSPPPVSSPVPAHGTSSPRAQRSPRVGRLHTSPTHAAHLVPPTSPTSRSSTPDLPPPPPPPVTDGEVVVSDEPLPPPPTPSEVATPPPEVPPLPPDSPPRERPSNTPPPPLPRDPNRSNISTPQTYHKDSYMAHRRDWKTGFEGRYRRTISPSAANRNLLYSREDSTINNNNTNNPSSSGTPSSPTSNKQQAEQQQQQLQQEQERRNSNTPPAGVLRSVASTSSLVHNNNSKNVNNNGWNGHSRSTSTTVNFTAEELRAFKARRAHTHSQDGASLNSDNKENTPRQLHPSQSSPALSSPALSSSSGLRCMASDGSTTSLASAGAGSSLSSGRSGSPASPSKLSPAHSWRTSLDSLHRPPSSTTTSTTTTTHSPRPITRATSLADPLHTPEEVAMSSSMSQEALHLPRTASINESLSRISAISDSLSRSTSVADSLCRSVSISETPTTTSSHSRTGSVSEAPTYLSSPSVAPPVTTAPASPCSPVPHDGPITAHPATVTEEPSTPASTQSPKSSGTPRPPSSPKSPLSTKSLSPKSSLTPKDPTSPASPLSVSSPKFPITTTSRAMTSSALDTIPPYTVTSPSMSPYAVTLDRKNIIVLSYGRTRNQEEIECDQLSKDYAPQLTLDSKTQALLAPGPEHKTAAHYMQGVFTLELRKDLISSSHAQHPDLSSVHTSRTMPPSTTPTTPPPTNAEATVNGFNSSSEKAPLPADSAYFTTSESKAKLLTRLRGNGNSVQEAITPVADQSQLHKKKEELVASIGRKLEILRAEKEAIKEEMRLNHELGAQVTCEVEARARLAEAEKYKLHVEEIDKITSLLLGLSGRLARAENALLMLTEDVDPEEKRILEGKRDKLSEQLEEAKRLKENIDRRAIQVSKVLNQYLTEDEYADYDHFIKMKAKLIMDAREIEDKIKLGEEQQQALLDTMSKKT